MSMDPNNPYASSPIAPQQDSVLVGPPRTQMDYAEALKAPFSGDNAILTLILCGLCMLLFSFVAPAMVMFGFGFEYLELQVRTGGKGTLAFNMDRISNYLSRGVWPWLMTLIAGLAVGCLAGIIFVPAILIIGMIFGDNGGFAMIFIFPLYFAFIIAVNVIASVAMLQAGVTQDSQKSFDINWIKDFISKMWKEMIIGGIVLFATIMAAEFIGALLFCVGLVPAAGYIALAQFSIQSQLYSLYLSRGGIPLSCKPNV